MLRIIVFLVSALMSFFSHGAVVLQYHHVSETTPSSTSIHPELFAEHLAYLDQHGYQIWSLERLAKSLKAKEKLPDKVVVITFDDAYLSIYETAFPLLKARDWPFTVFVSTDPVDKGIAPYMSWPQLRELKANGATIANHSHTHTHFVRMLDEESRQEWLQRIREEIVHADKRLQAELGDTPKLLAYPYGEYIEEIMSLVDALGYVAFGQQSGALGEGMPLSSLPRFPMTNQFGAMSQFKTKVASLPLVIDRIEPSQRIVGAETFKRGLSIQFKELRQGISCYLSGVGRVPLTQKGGHVTLESLPAIPAGRSRLNCTAPSKESGRFHWASYFWMKPFDDGRWYPEK